MHVTGFIIPSHWSKPGVFVSSIIPRSASFNPIERDVDNDNSNDSFKDSTHTTHLTDHIVSPVLRQVYPAILKHYQTFGHPNIPLGTSEGRQCATLRRLRNQEKLCENDIKQLDDLGFTWHSLEDVYEKQKEHFDDFIQRLQFYAATHNNDLSPPKKYPDDPELGAWVTALRRLRMVENAIDPEHIQVLNAMGFSWVSPRNCGSKFMLKYRQVRERLQEEGTAVWADPTVQKWVYAQQQADLSQTRRHYMAHILGQDWMEWKA
jgi:hypothetical protein